MRRIWIIVGCTTVFVLAAFLPTTYETVIREGTDSFRTHHALYGNRVKSVSFVAPSSIRAIGLILVNLRRSTTLAPVTVTVTSEGGGGVTVSRTLAPSVDDDFVWFDIPPGSIRGGQRVRVHASSPSATVANAVGIRFSDEDGELAIALRENIPAWKQLSRWAADNPRRFQRAMLIIVGGMVGTGLLALLDRISRSYKNGSIVAACLILVAMMLYTRVPLSKAVESAYGGDAFNYILKGHAWIVGDDPFAADFRKAPLYPFIVAPGLIQSLDPVLWARGISIVASIGTVLFVLLLLLGVGVSLPIALLSAALLAVNRDFQFESIQGLSNPLYACCVMAAAYAFVLKRPYIVSVAAALAAITRFEGVLVAAVLAPASWVLSRPRLSSMLRNMIPLIVIGGLPLVLFPFTGALGVRSISDLRSDEGLYLGYTWEYLLPSINALKGMFGRLWILQQSIGNPFLWFWGGAILGIIAIPLASRYVRQKNAIAVFPLAVCIPIIVSIVTGFDGDMKFLIGLYSGLAGLGLGASLVTSPRVALPLVLVVFSQIAVVTAILPKNRYYLQVIPFVAMSIGVAVWYVGGARVHKRLPALCATFLMTMLVLFAYDNASVSLPGQVSDYNEKSVQQTVLLRAVRAVRVLGGIVGVPENGDLIARSYISLGRVVILPDSLRNIDAQYNLLQEKRVSYIIDTTDNPYFTKLIYERPVLFEKLGTYTTKWGDDTATIYRVLPK